jgi:WD domain, G-beta repeat
MKVPVVGTDWSKAGMATIQEPLKSEAEAQGPSWQAELTFRDWKAGLEAARANWAGAPINLKPPLLLRGGDLTTATSWLISRPRDLTPQQQSFVRKSIARSYNSAAEDHRHQDAERKKKLKSWISFGATVSAFVLFLGLELALYDLWVKATGAVYVTQETPKPNFSGPRLPPHAEPSATADQGASPVGMPEPSPIHAQPAPTNEEVTEKSSGRQVPLAQLAERSLEEARSGDPVRARLIALEALSDVSLKEPLPDDLFPALSAIQFTQKSARSIVGPSDRLDMTRASISRDGKSAFLVASDQTASWASLSSLTGVPAARNIIHSGQAIVGVDDAHVALKGSDDGIRLWPAGASQPVSVLRGHEGGVTALAVSPNGQKVATASWDETVRIWDVRSGRNQMILQGHEGPVLTAAFSPDGARLVTAGEDRTARIWSVADGKPLAILRGHLSQVQSAAFDPAGRQVLTTSLDGTARLWDAAIGEETAVMRMESGPVFSAAFSASSRRVATLSSKSELMVWNADDGQAVATYPSQGYAVRAYAIGGEGDLLFVLTVEGTILLKEADSGIKIGLFQASSGDHIITASFAPGGKSILAITARHEMLAWPIQRSLKALVQELRETTPRCLTVAERIELQLDSVIPRWCTDHAKTVDAQR